MKKPQLCALAVAAVYTNVIAMVVTHRNELCAQSPSPNYIKEPMKLKLLFIL